MLRIHTAKKEQPRECINYTIFAFEHNVPTFFLTAFTLCATTNSKTRNHCGTFNGVVRLLKSILTASELSKATFSPETAAAGSRLVANRGFTHVNVIIRSNKNQDVLLTFRSPHTVHKNPFSCLRVLACGPYWHVTKRFATNSISQVTAQLVYLLLHTHTHRLQAVAIFRRLVCYSGRQIQTVNIYIRWHSDSAVNIALKLITHKR
jgi:hypothetical protein